MARSDRVAAQQDAADLFKMAGEPVRLATLEALREKPRHVGAMVELLGVNQMTLSHHLTLMRLVGLVASERQGRLSIYTVTPLGRSVLKCADSLVPK